MPSQPELVANPSSAPTHRFILTLFTATIFTSAFLLFWVEPLIGKMVLPLLGGTPVVWNTCMMFFQGMLLFSYCYVHVGRRFFQMHTQMILHFLLISAALFSLPIIIPHSAEVQNLSHPIPWLLSLLIMKAGLPLFVIASTAPLLQLWFSQSNHPQCDDPYFLYAGSNLGSLIALLLFPVMLEPFLSISLQRYLWMGSFIVFAVLLAYSSIFVNRQPTFSPSTQTRTPTASRVRWTLLAFAPSSLLLGVTHYLTTDVAAVPLFWILPLAIYLLTFVFCFSHKNSIPIKWLHTSQPFLLLPLVLLMTLSFMIHSISLTFLIHLSVFFACAMICHHELVQSRPKSEHLTEFYFWMGLGGFLGGVFNALLAPLIFNGLVEYPLAIALCCALRPGHKQFKWQDLIVPLGIFVFFFVLNNFGIKNIDLLLISFCIATVLVMSAPEKNIRLGLGVGVLIAVGQLYFYDNSEEIVFHERSYFGTLKVLHDKKRDAHIMMHGTTIHGAQFNGNEEINSYFEPLLEVFSMMQNKKTDLSIAVAGLGTGTLACRVRETDSLHYFEIDPLVLKVASNDKYFSFLTNCPPKGGIVMGDARINLQKAGNASFDIIVLDAFNSDAVPVHLITKEAVEMYLEKLKPGGVIVFNITNRYLKLHYVLSAIAAELGLEGTMTFDHKFDRERYKFPSYWVALSRDKATFDQLAWDDLKTADKQVLWDDDYSNVMRLVW